ncbi:MAG: 23S rRNA (uridine(2479)-2'-O)-methyltransferase [Chlamydiales bacterium]|nr:23S rRNA (uridine(2479)-2'-O)-methyltransferase [Chlamydiales bacterium]MCH9619245.1 23S rRNA (uridine(2479)-2'-O)-methyltransferase [Chlamydiales bacterium]MCH9622507.1 23S rRNA (uridine(2479)-2'-O)-methyltransferase [Chlamydiales bacterium]
MYISSKQNPKVKELIRLYKRRERDLTDRFLIEGYRELSRAALHPIDALYICRDLFLGSNEQQLIDAIDAPVYECSEAVFRALSYRDRPDGLIAVAPQQHRSLQDLSGEFFVIAEAIEKPGNLGTILRSSDGAGVDGVIICDRCTDLHNPNVVRASVGTLFTQPVVEATGDETHAWLRKNKIRCIAATPSAEAVYTDVDLTGPLAILVGTEQYGLSDMWMKGADLQVKIPMCGVADSLNVAMATTLLLYEALRQR